jgi:tRNA threonylcarbamoyladenosine biosynthesis protein TsaE
MISDSAAETKRIGKVLGSVLRDGDVVFLYGELGAGKTVLVSGIAEALGYEDEYITSPTYTIVNEYKNLRTDLYHMDAYRIDSHEELIDVGILEYAGVSGIVVIEWAERVESGMPFSICTVRVAIEKNGRLDDLRRITVKFADEARGKSYEDKVRGMI